MTNPKASRRSISLICLAVVIAFVSGLDGQFVLDDHHNIVDKAAIRTLWPPWIPLSNTTRPLVQATLALNYAVSELNPWSYHVLNIAFHLAAALSLFGISRRVLAQFPKTARHSCGIALTGAIIWAVHPLQTESVTYIIQRAEVIMGLAVFLMVYCFQRSTESPKAQRWLFGAIAACLLGFAAKPIMVVAPLLLWLFDRQFISGTFGLALRSRPRFYVALLCSPLVLILFLAGNTAEWKGSAGIGELPVTWYEYAATQPEIILYYLRLAVWPTPLCLDYGWPIERSSVVIVFTSLVILGAMAWTVWALARKHVLGFLGAWFFINLAPTSSLIPIADLAFEHRIYLALASVVFAGVSAVYLLCRDRAPNWAMPAMTLAMVAYFTAFTFVRNRDYASVVWLWIKNAAARPAYARPLNNLGLELGKIGEPGLAIEALRRAIDLKPDYAIAHYNLGKALIDAGRAQEARVELEIALEQAPDDPKTYAELARASQQLGDRKSAVAFYANAARLNQGDPNAWAAFALALIDVNRHAEAVKVLDQAIRLHPNSTDLIRSLAILLAASPDDQVRQPARALTLGRQVAALTRGTDPIALDALGMAQAESGDYDAAIKTTDLAIARARDLEIAPAVIAPMESRVRHYRDRKPWRLEATTLQAP
jgi:tetratricopeptide (TPR) repeat protein